MQRSILWLWAILSFAGLAGGETLPLASTEFSDCVTATGRSSMPDIQSCAGQLELKQRMLLSQCLNRSARASLATVIRACTASMEARILQGEQLSVLFANRADAYVGVGDKRHALDDYNIAIELAPDNAALYYNRGIDYAAQGDTAAALKDYESALRIDPTLVPALHKQAQIYRTQGNFSGALLDYSEALRLKPKMATIWSERGFIYLLQRDYRSAAADEDQAIRLDPNLAQAYLFRGMVYGRLGDAGKARSNIATALRLDPTLKRYVTINNESAAVTPPP